MLSFSFVRRDFKACAFLDKSLGWCSVCRVGLMLIHFILNRFSNERVVPSDWEVCIGSESVPSVVFYDQSREVLCSMIIVEASKVGDILRFVDLLIKCNFSPELIYY